MGTHMRLGRLPMEEGMVPFRPFLGMLMRTTRPAEHRTPNQVQGLVLPPQFFLFTHLLPPMEL